MCLMEIFPCFTFEPHPQAEAYVRLCVLFHHWIMHFSSTLDRQVLHPERNKHQLTGHSLNQLDKSVTTARESCMDNWNSVSCGGRDNRLSLFTVSHEQCYFTSVPTIVSDHRYDEHLLHSDFIFRAECSTASLSDTLINL